MLYFLTRIYVLSILLAYVNVYPSDIALSDSANAKGYSVLHKEGWLQSANKIDYSFEISITGSRKNLCIPGSQTSGEESGYTDFIFDVDGLLEKRVYLWGHFKIFMGQYTVQVGCTDEYVRRIVQQSESDKCEERLCRKIYNDGQGKKAGYEMHFSNGCVGAELTVSQIAGIKDKIALNTLSNENLFLPNNVVVQQVGNPTINKYPLITLDLTGIPDGKIQIPAMNKNNSAVCCMNFVDRILQNECMLVGVWGVKFLGWNLTSVCTDNNDRYNVLLQSNESSKPEYSQEYNPEDDYISVTYDKEQKKYCVKILKQNFDETGTESNDSVNQDFIDTCIDNQTIFDQRRWSVNSDGLLRLNLTDIKESESVNIKDVKYNGECIIQDAQFKSELSKYIRICAPCCILLSGGNRIVFQKKEISVLNKEGVALCTKKSNGQDFKSCSISYSSKINNGESDKWSVGSHTYIKDNLPISEGTWSTDKDGIVKLDLKGLPEKGWWMIPMSQDPEKKVTVTDGQVTDGVLNRITISGECIISVMDKDGDTVISVSKNHIMVSENWGSVTYIFKPDYNPETQSITLFKLLDKVEPSKQINKIKSELLSEEGKSDTESAEKNKSGYKWNVADVVKRVAPAELPSNFVDEKPDNNDEDPIPLDITDNSWSSINTGGSEVPLLYLNSLPQKGRYKISSQDSNKKITITDSLFRDGVLERMTISGLGIIHLFQENTNICIDARKGYINIYKPNDESGRKFLLLNNYNPATQSVTITYDQKTKEWNSVIAGSNNNKPTSNNSRWVRPVFRGIAGVVLQILVTYCLYRTYRYWF